MAKKRIAFITTYNPSAVGIRYVAAGLLADGHEVRLFHLKQPRAIAIPTTELEQHERLKREQQKFQFVSMQHPGEVLYFPYPTPITDQERGLLLSALAEFKPDLIGIPTFTVTIGLTRTLTSWLRESLPATPVIWGGVHCLVRPEDCVPPADDDSPGQPASAYPDIVCAAEGERPMRMLLEQWEEYTTGTIPAIPGMWFVREGVVHKFDRLPLEQDLDRLEPPVYAADELMIENDEISRAYADPHGPIRDHIYVFTSRGCPYKCSYCVHSLMNKLDPDHRGIRSRTPANVCDEVEQLVARHGLDHIIMHDDIFAFEKKWVLEFCREWTARLKPRGITFTGYVHPLTTDEEMVAALADAGMTRTGFGVQTGSERVAREVYDRPLKRDKIIALSRTLARYPFKQVQVDVISDSPFETEQDRRKTLELLVELEPPFHLETFGLVVYATSGLAEKQPLMDEVPWAERLFWNMLYHLTGLKSITPETVLALSHDEYLREHPLVLEQLVVDLNGGYFRRNKAYLRPHDEQADTSHVASPPPAAPRPLYRRIGGRVKRALKRVLAGGD
ncbi:B12-binding domain-containing radical SAM protein [Candidatus Sumerlaeota bacterium]